MTKRTPKDPATLTAKQLRFVEEYLVDCNAAAAAVRAGYSPNGAKVTASQLLTNPNLAAEVERRMGTRSQAVKIEAEEVLRRFAVLAGSDIGSYLEYDDDGVTVKALSDLTPEQRMCISEVYEERDKEGNKSIRLKLHDKTDALKQLAKHLGLLLNRVQVGGDPKGEPIKSELGWTADTINAMKKLVLGIERKAGG